MTLLINACARSNSRTLRLSKYLAEKIDKYYTELKLYDENIKPLDEKALSYRDSMIADKQFSDNIFRYAYQFSRADKIIIAAPYWDLSFPSVLKNYIEAICVCGLTFRYLPSGEPQGLCRAEQLYYVTTAGGYIPARNYGFDYIDELCKTLFGIQKTRYIKAEGLDIFGANVESILSKAEAEINIYT